MGKVLDWIYDHRWAITENALETIVKIASREMEKGSLDAIASKIDKPMAFTDRVTVRNGVATIPVIGPIFPRANLFTKISGATSIETLATDFRTVMESDEIESLVFDIDSPGGEVTGVSEFANMVFSSRGQGKKITAYINGMGASAAYWIASAADEIVLADTAEAGSIGVVAAYRDTSEAEAKQGIKKIEIISSISPLKRANPSTDEGHKKIQEIVDHIAGVFVQTVARNRGTDEETVLEDFGRGGLYVGALAVGQGLADRLGSYEEIMDEHIASQSPSYKPITISEGGRNMNVKKDENGNVVMTAEAVRESSPETYKEIFESGKREGMKEGAESERTRIQEIETIDVPGSEKIVAENKFKPEMTKDKISSLVLADQSEKQKQAKENMEKDGKETEEAGQGADQQSDEAEQRAVAEAMVAGANRQRKVKGNNVEK